MTFIEKIVGGFDDKRRWREYKARVRGLPPAYRLAVEALERYFNYAGGIAKGEVLVRMLDDLADLFEQSAASATPVRAVVGDDPVEFAETFLANYADGQWINRERARLVAAMERAASGADAVEEQR